MKKNLLKSNAVQSLIASLVCILLGLFIGYLALLIINPAGAGKAIFDIVKNFLTYNKPASQLKYFGNTLVKTAPLLMCALSVLFAYKVGLFNIGAAGQYVAGSCACLYAALAWGWGWLPCMLLAIVSGAVFGCVVGLLKSYCNVNEVISGIMLNWIGLYTTNMILTNVKEDTSPYTLQMKSFGKQAILPSLGFDKLLEGADMVFSGEGKLDAQSLLGKVVIGVARRAKRAGVPLVAVVGDALGTLLTGQAINLGLSLATAISGLLYGLFLYKRPLSWVRVMLCLLAVSLFCHFLLNTYFLAAAGYMAVSDGTDWPVFFRLLVMPIYGEGATLPAWISVCNRLIKQVAVYPVNVVMLYLMLRGLKRMPKSIIRV